MYNYITHMHEQYLYIYICIYIFKYVYHSIYCIYVLKWSFILAQKWIYIVQYAHRNRLRKFFNRNSQDMNKPEKYSFENQEEYCRYNYNLN